MRISTKPTRVIAQDLICEIFEDMDRAWLRTTWEDEGTACSNMNKILISLALLKLISRLGYVDYF
jgi:hypothetical protein